MKLRIPEYSGSFKILSLALDEATKDDLIGEEVEFIYAQESEAIVFPDGDLLTKDKDILARLRECNNYDVFEISDNGSVTRCYDNSSLENTFFITEKCNSNCIMCPSSDYSRQRGGSMKISDLISIASHIPTDASHITVTGGEPFMAGKDIFRLFEYCKDKFKDTEFLVLTNARIFAVREYCELLKETLPDHSTVGVPLHGSCPQIHDAITRSKNSFDQTVTGLARLQNIGVNTEIRIVVCKNNVTDIPEIARLIVERLNKADHVSIMAMEMTGNAHKNAEAVWIPYRDSFIYVKAAIEILVTAGIDVKLYNYPLCTVDKEYWMICAKSISSWKVKYAPVCEHCIEKASCGGVFAGSFRLVSGELEALT